jgi:hypothetical protein
MKVRVCVLDAVVVEEAVDVEVAVLVGMGVRVTVAVWVGMEVRVPDLVAEAVLESVLVYDVVAVQVDVGVDDAV